MKGQSRFFLDISIDSGPGMFKYIILGKRVIIETFDEKVPKTVYNFKCLCTGEKGISANGIRLWYKDTEFHRVVDGFMIQGGDVSMGAGGESIYGGLFEDEEVGEFELPWQVAMANKGKDANGSQFFITTEPAPHLNGEAVVFGHVISGFEVLKEIERIPTNDDFYPESKVVISHCGELIRKKKSVQEEPIIKEPVKIDEEIATENVKEEISNLKNNDSLQDLQKDLKLDQESDSEDNAFIDSDYEYPSVQVPHFNEPKSFLERGGRDPNWKPFNSINKDKDGRKVKGRGNLKYKKPDSAVFRSDPYKRSREKSRERREKQSSYRSRSRSRSRSRTRRYRDRSEDRYSRRRDERR